MRWYTTFGVAAMLRLTVVPNRRVWVPSNVAVASDRFCLSRGTSGAIFTRHTRDFDKYCLLTHIYDKTSLKGSLNHITHGAVGHQSWLNRHDSTCAPTIKEHICRPKWSRELAWGQQTCGMRSVCPTRAMPAPPPLPSHATWPLEASNPPAGRPRLRCRSRGVFEICQSQGGS